MESLVGVYGTLRKGFPWHHLLKDASFIDSGYTEELYALYAERIPYLIKEKKISRVFIEVYQVNQETLMRLDQLEGHPNWYNREEVKVVLEGSGKKTKVWIYFYPEPRGEIVPSGDYMNVFKKV